MWAGRRVGSPGYKEKGGVCLILFGRKAQNGRGDRTHSGRKEDMEKEVIRV